VDAGEAIRRADGGGSPVLITVTMRSGTGPAGTLERTFDLRPGGESTTWWPLGAKMVRIAASDPEPGEARTTMSHPAAGQFCTWKLQPGDATVRGVCPECGHSSLAHIGVGHCPVCELVYQATPQFRRQQERIHGPRRVWMREG
jgi:predicted RNA-binding Zn-ribbon protein involved in translation (DUF1610 family)